MIAEQGVVGSANCVKGVETPEDVVVAGQECVAPLADLRWPKRDFEIAIAAMCPKEMEIHYGWPAC